MAGWGTGSWGLGSWGSLPGPLYVVSATAIANRTVRIELSVAPLDLSAGGTGDALNPATWFVMRLDTGFSFTIASVVEVTSTVFDLILVEELGGFFVTHEAGSYTLVKPTGGLIQTPYTAQFPGISASVETARQQVFGRDLANPPAPTGFSVGGTLRMNAAGDYELVAGAELVKKLIIRRLVTTPGDFFHLPNYGLGLAVKEPLRTNDLISLRKDAERQILEEPEVQAAQVSLSLSSDGILNVIARARLRPTGETVETTFKLPTT